MNIFSSTIHTLEQSLSAAALKQQTHAANIANADTPNYKARTVDFQAALSDAFARQNLVSHKTDSRHLSFTTEGQDPRINANSATVVKINGNNVDMDVEMAELAKNQLHYNAVTDRLSGKFRSLGTVINEGR